MKRALDRIYTSLSKHTPPRSAALRYGMGLLIVVLIFMAIHLQVRYPQFTSSHLPLFAVVLMLLLNFVADGISWSSPQTRFFLHVASWTWIVFTLIFIAYHHPA